MYCKGTVGVLVSVRCRRIPWLRTGGHVCLRATGVTEKGRCALSLGCVTDREILRPKVVTFFPSSSSICLNSFLIFPSLSASSFSLKCEAWQLARAIFSSPSLSVISKVVSDFGAQSTFHFLQKKEKKNMPLVHGNYKLEICEMLERKKIINQKYPE